MKDHTKSQYTQLTGRVERTSIPCMSTISSTFKFQEHTGKNMSLYLRGFEGKNVSQLLKL